MRGERCEIRNARYDAGGDVGRACHMMPAIDRYY
jgi:hypothetical protein